MALNGLISIRLSARVQNAIAFHAAGSADGRETGGILLGYDESEFGAMLVMEAGGPGPGAERHPDFFKRDLAHAQRLAAEALASTSSRWIGEWHTHPGGCLAPSRTDLRTYRSFLRDADLGFSVFLALIVGPGDAGWARPQARGWLVEQRRFFPTLVVPSARSVELTIELAHEPDESETGAR